MQAFLLKSRQIHVFDIVGRHHRHFLTEQPIDIQRVLIRVLYQAEVAKINQASSIWLSMMIHVAEVTTLAQVSSIGSKLLLPHQWITLFRVMIRIDSISSDIQALTSFYQLDYCINRCIAACRRIWLPNPTACGCGEASAVTLRLQQKFDRS